MLVAATLLPGGARGAEATDPVRIGSKRFTESYILGELAVQSMRAAGAPAEHRQGLGNTAILFEALKAGAIDAYPDYTGTIARELLRLENTDPAAMRRGLAALGLGLTAPLGFDNTYVLAMARDRADALGVRSIADLAGQPGLRLGLSHEFLLRNDGWPGLQRAYRLPQSPRGLDHGLAYEALRTGRIDVIDAYATDARLAREALAVLADDGHFFPEYAAVFVHRLDLPARHPRAWQALGALAGRIDAATMAGLNARAELDGLPFAAVAADFLREGPPADEAPARPAWTARLFGADFWRLTREHLLLVGISLAAAVAAGVPLGIAAARRPRLGQVLMAAAGTLQTVPALALLAFLIPLLGRIGLLPALVALFLYSLLPIVRNTHAGLCDIAPALREAAVALGLPAGARLWRVELPLAARAILAGIKTSAVINVGTATIAAFIGAGGYGERIVSGLALNDHGLLLAGAVPAAGLALLVQGGFELLERRLVSPGLR